MLQIKDKDIFVEWKNVFLISYAVCILGICVSVFNFSLSIDAWGLIFRERSFIQEGRWVYHIFHNMLCSKTVIPVISPVISIAIMVLAGIGLCLFWSVKSDFSRILTVCIFVIHPYMVDLYNFTEVQLSFSVGYALAAIALLLSDRKYFFLPIFIASIAFASYQIVLCFMISAIAVRLLKDCIDKNKDIKGMLLRVLQHLIILALAVILYLVVFKILLLAMSLEANQRVQQGLISSWNDLVMKMGVTAIVSAVRFLPVSEFVIGGFAKTLSVVILLLGFAVAIKTNIGKDRNLGKICIVSGIFVLMPLLAFSVLVPLKSHAMPFRISVGVIIFIAGTFAISSDSENKLLKLIVRFIGAILVVNFIFNNNALFFRQYMQNQRDIALANRIAYRIESLPDYKPGMKLVIYGNMSPDAYKMQGNYRKIFTEYFNHCRKRKYSVSSGAFETDFSKYSILTNYLKIPLKPVFSDYVLSDNEALVNHKGVWPSADSVFVVDDTVVVIISK